MQELLKAIENAKVLIGKVQATGSNPYFNSKYMTLEGIYQAIGTKLTDQGLSLVQTVKDMNLETRITHIESGEFIYSMMPLKGETMQALGSAVTYARRYSIVTMLGIIEADDDGNKATYQEDPFANEGGDY